MSQPRPLLLALLLTCVPYGAQENGQVQLGPPAPQRIQLFVKGSPEEAVARSGTKALERAWGPDSPQWLLYNQAFLPLVLEKYLRSKPNLCFDEIGEETAFMAQYSKDVPPWATRSTFIGYVNQDGSLYTVESKGKPSLRQEALTKENQKAREKLTKKEKEEKDAKLRDHCLLGKFDLVRELLAQGANPKLAVRDLTGVLTTLLHLAVWFDNKEAVETFLNYGLSVDVRSSNGDSPLVSAVKRGKVVSSSCLLECGANPNNKDLDAIAPLHCVTGRYTMNNCTRTALLLLAYGAHLELRNRDGDTALHGAVFEGNVVVAKYLITYGANVNAQNNNGNTPLHKAVSWAVSYAFLPAVTPRWIPVAKYLVTSLLDAGADPNITNHQGLTPLQLARKKGLDKLVDLLSSPNCSAKPRAQAEPLGPDIKASLNRATKQYQRRLLPLALKVRKEPGKKVPNLWLYEETEIDNAKVWSPTVSIHQLTPAPDLHGVILDLFIRNGLRVTETFKTSQGERVSPCLDTTRICWVISWLARTAGSNHLPVDLYTIILKQSRPGGGVLALPNLDAELQPIAWQKGA